MKPILFAVAAGLCWGIGEVCTRSALHAGKVGPIGAITVRSLVAIPLLLLVFWLMTRGVGGIKVEPSLAQADGGTWTKLVLGSGLVAGGLAMIFFYMGLSFGEVSVVKPIAFSIAPAVGVTLGWLVLGETMDARKVIALGLILSGVLVLTMKGAAPATAAQDATAQDDGHRGAERGSGAGSDPTESAEAARPGMR
ncbi:MAG: EamA family transporter [Phycisphaerales bacterium]